MTLAILTCSEHFHQFALNEIRRYQPTVQAIEQLSPQHHLIQTPLSFSRFTSPWHHKLSIYLHHLFPVEVQLPVDKHLDRFVKKISQQFPAFRKAQVRVIGDTPHQAYDIRQAIHRSPHHTNDKRILTLLIAGGCCYAGLSQREHNLSPYTLGRPYFREGVPNRAGLKLLEALDAFGIHLRKGSHALDLGAAPGAWTLVLRRRDIQVTAVAPDEMYPDLQDDPCVTHFHMTAEDYLTQYQPIFDLIVNDMKMDAQDSARLMVAYADALRDNGIAIMTLKLRMRNTMRVMDHSYRILRKAYKIVQVRQLVSNKKEVTLFLRKK